jgi:outer membrane protein OmpA-like peptidoglycan-associated protein
MVGGSLGGVLGLTGGGQLELRFTQFPDIIAPVGDIRSQRQRSFSAEWRQTLVGHQRSVGLTLGGGAHEFSLGAVGGTPEETRITPFGALGLSLRLPIAGPLTATLRGGAQFTLARINELGAIAFGSRGVATTPFLAIEAGFLFRKRAPGMSLDDRWLPLATDATFQPIAAQTPPGVLQPLPHRHPEAAPPKSFGTATTSKAAGEIHYDLGAHGIPQSAFPMLQATAAYLKANPTAELELIGYTDAIGGIAINQSLAERRGTAIRDYLARIQEIPEERMQVKVVGVNPQFKNSMQARKIVLVVHEIVPGIQ